MRAMRGVLCIKVTTGGDAREESGVKSRYGVRCAREETAGEKRKACVGMCGIDGKAGMLDEGRKEKRVRSGRQGDAQRSLGGPQRCEALSFLARCFGWRLASAGGGGPPSPPSSSVTSRRKILNVLTTASERAREIVSDPPRAGKGRRSAHSFGM